MKIALIQNKIYWEDASKNIAHFSELITSIAEVDIVVLPEMFSSGFTMNSKKVAQTMSGDAVKWLKQTAQELGVVIIGSLVISEENKYFNRLIWADPSGSIKTYDKRHLFRMANENNFFTAGKERVIINYKGIRFCPLICYDLRFPVWSRNKGSNDNNPVYDCLIYVANWPEARTEAWKSLLQARAIENQAYVIGVNRVGSDDNGINYSGDSRCFSPKGERLDDFKSNEPQIEIIEINMEQLDEYRKKFPVSMDADSFTIE